jgi:peptide-methionine (S)-S-oxide reductase
MKETAYLAGGCFWCTEAVFKGLKGVISATPGYSGGTVDNPTYEEVCGGKTGHTETARIEFDPSILTYSDLLKVFFGTHDPTTMDRQGDDTGPQYRSIVFYASQDQKNAADSYIRELEEKKAYSKPIVTEVRPFVKFFEAEDYHKNYYEAHKDAPYCQIVITPKLEKLKDKYREFLR